MTTGSILVAVVFAALYVAFLVWYGGKGKPLSHAEVDALHVLLNVLSSTRTRRFGTPNLASIPSVLTEHEFSTL